MNAPLPSGFATRPIRPDDRPAILALIAASDTSLIGEVDYHQEDLLDEWGRPRFDLATDPVLVLAPDGTAAGYAFVWESEPRKTVTSWTAVHPDHERVELYAYLLGRIEGRARGLVPEGGTLRAAVYEAERLLPGLLRAAGFAPVRYFWRMVLPLSGDESPPDEPPGVRLRSFVPGTDDRAAHLVIEEAFAEHWGTPTEPFEEWTEDHLRGDGFEPGLWVLAEADGAVAGALAGRRTGDRGWIAELGVRPGWRGRGIGAALLRESFARFARAGLREALLSVDSENATGATRLYERVGMRSRFRFDFYEKRLP